MIRRRSVPLWALALGVASVALAGLASGPSEVGFGELVGLLGWGPDRPEARTIILGLRLPRVGLGLAVGAGLATAGALMQAVFRNPLAEPSLIGVSSGAALGAAMVFVFARELGVPPALEATAVTLAAGLGGAVVVAVVRRVAERGGAASTASLLLAGLALTSLVNAALGLALHLAEDGELRSLTFWLLGSLGGASGAQVAVAALIMALPLVLALRLARPLDTLLLGVAEARHLGVDVERVQRRAIGLSALMVGASVALCGIIGFVGLLVPHLVRLGSGPGHRGLLPRAALGGAGLVVLADLVARTAVAPVELPVGILTALLGAPFFLYLLVAGAARDGAA